MHGAMKREMSNDSVKKIMIQLNPFELMKTPLYTFTAIF